MLFEKRALLLDPGLFQSHDPFLARLLASRTTDTRTISTLKNMLPPSTMKGIDDAAIYLVNAILKKSHIVIVGDYDCDGATGTSVGICGLRMLGATKVSFVVPNRFTEGYGLSVGVLNRAAELKPDLILTVDNGISAHAGIEAASKLGIPVVVTDHHLPSDTNPDAVAIVNPNQVGCEFESKNLAGVGVVFYLLIAVRQILRQRNHFGGAAPLHELLDLVALGTVADVVRLDYNNRLLVQAGLSRIRAGSARAGILQLFMSAKKQRMAASSEDLGFLIGPRINSAGRMEDASTGIECLSTEDELTATKLANLLHQTNQQRRLVQKEIEHEAIDGLPTEINPSQSSICLFDENWHQGVIGVVCGRIKEKFYRPTIVFTRASENTAKGSARSIPGLHLRDCLDLINKKCPGLIHKFGGHAAAAGLDIDIQRMDEFRKAFEDVVSSMLTPADLRQVVEHDGVIQDGDLTLQNARLIENTVWGQGFPAPQFIVDAPKILDQRTLKESHLKMQLRVGQNTVDAIWFGNAEKVTEGTSFLAKISINEWNGNSKPQLIISESI